MTFGLFALVFWWVVLTLTAATFGVLLKRALVLAAQDALVKFYSFRIQRMLRREDDEALRLVKAELVKRL